MYNLMKTNCMDIENEIIIIGSCIPKMHPKIFQELLKMSENIYEVCMEEIHLNMVITKLGGILCRTKIKSIIFVTVDKSPHCIQLHYVENELKKMMNLNDIEIFHYVIANNKLVKVSKDKIKSSRQLGE